MKHLSLLLFIVNCNLLYSQGFESSKDTLYSTYKINKSIVIDSTTLEKRREMNASGALLYETCNVISFNSSYYSPTSTILQRGGLTPIYSLNGIPLHINPPYINIFNVESIELSNESFNKSSSFLSGSVNLELKKPRLNKPLNIMYEGNLVSGGIMPNPTFDIMLPRITNNGSFLMNNISIEKGKERYASRFSFSNARSTYENSFIIFDEDKNNIHLSYNTFGFDFLAKPSTKFSLNTNLYYSFKTLRYESSAGKNSEIYDLLFFDASGVYNLSEETTIKTQIGTLTSSQLYNDSNGNTPFYGSISIERNKKLSEKSKLETSLNYSFLTNNSIISTLENRSNLHSVIGAATIDFLNRLKIRASFSNELYNDDNQQNYYIIVPSIDFQFNLINNKGNEDLKNTCVLFSNYTYSNRKTSYLNLNQKFEAGVNSSFLNNRIGLNVAFYYYSRKNELILQSTSWPFNDLSIVTFDSYNQGVELKNRNTLVKTKRITWIITGNFAWNRVNYNNIKSDNNTSVNLSSLFPEFRYSFASEFSFKTFSFSCLFDAMNRQQETTYDIFNGTFNKEYSSSISLRQVNLTYTYPREKLSTKKIKMFELSVYLKNAFSYWNRPNNYIDTNYNYDLHNLGVNLRLGF